MLARLILTAFVALTLASSAGAAVKFYNGTADNGTLGDARRISINLCPPEIVTPGDNGGYQHLIDEGTGTVTLAQWALTADSLTDLSGDILIPIFGPGAFIFIDNGSTRTISTPSTSNTSGVGNHGPSATAPGSTTEWGVVTGFVITGEAFCISSPVSICNQNGFGHGATTPRVLTSTSFNLGTWTFDASGDLQGSTWMMNRTSNGGLSNNMELTRGFFTGSSLPALPLVGFGALALSLAIVGGRSLMGKK